MRDVKNKEELLIEIVEKIRGKHIMEKSWKWKLTINKGISKISTEQ